MWLLFALLGVLAWSIVNVLDSFIVGRFEKHPMILLWSQSWFSMTLLCIALLVYPPHFSPWVWIFLLAGISTYIGDIVFIVVLKRVDVSISNLSWVMASLMLSVIGFLAFHESWTALQWVGAASIIAGILHFSLWNKRFLTVSSFLLLFSLALLYLPFSVLQKAALMDGQRIYDAFVWPMAMREALCFFVPLLIPSLRRRAVGLVRKVTVPFALWNGLVIASFFAGVIFLELSYAFGPLSLTTIVSNIQPFLVILIAFMLARFLPSIAPREALDTAAIRSKILGFFFVFLGLALLALPQ